jgi:hypothetical protein
MYIATLIVLPCLFASAFATTHNLTGSFSKFKAESMKAENHAVEDLYNSCKELDQDGNLLSVREGCVATLLWSTYQVLHAATQVQPVAVIHNGTVLNEKASNEGGVSVSTTEISTEAAAMTAPSSSSSSVSLTTSSGQYTSPQTYESKLKRQRDITDSILLERINDELSEQGGGRLGVRALDIGESEVHPSDGIAIRTNIHGNNAVLHVHTNGSYATAEFKKENSSYVTRRDQDASIAHSFQFSEKSFGVKVQVNKISRVNVSLSDMRAYWNAFGYGSGEVNMDPAFRGSDSWRFIVCDKSWGVIAGKVIALEGPSDYVYESIDDTIDCA